MRDYRRLGPDKREMTVLSDWLTHPLIVYVAFPAVCAGLATLAVREKDKVGIWSTREKRLLFFFFLILVAAAVFR